MAVELSPEQVNELAEALRARTRGKDTRQLERERFTAAASIQTLSERLQAAYNEQRDLDERMAAIAAGADRNAERFRSQVASIAKMAQVERVEVDAIGLHIYTKNIISQPIKDGTRRIFGAFHVSINWTGQVHAECTNKKDVKRPDMTQDYFFKYEHPHVFPTNQAGYEYPKSNICFGNIGRQVTQYVGEGDFDVAASLTVQFLEQFNENGHYRADAWKVWEPEKEPDTGVANDHRRNPIALRAPMTRRYVQCPGVGTEVDRRFGYRAECPVCQQRQGLVQHRDARNAPTWHLADHGTLQPVPQEAA